MLINKYLTFKNIRSVCITTIVIITMSDKINIITMLRPSGIDGKYYYWCPASNVCLYVTICNVPRTAHSLYIYLILLFTICM